ncbi:aspartate aminotransferase [Arthrobacter sp. Hiyo4]|nr:aspartate aminotransferase [Arthrobacter sp. Hiyo4]
MTSRLLNAVPVGYPLYPEHDFQPRIQDIEALITDRTRVLILNSPSNPLGAVLGEDLTRQLVDLARRRDLWIISDECYEAFTYDVPHLSPARFDSDVPGEARVFTSLTLSKTYGLTGLRIGALVCPPGLEQKMNNVMEAIVSCVASPSQYAALAALTGPQDYVRHAHDHYRTNRDAASALLAAKGIPYLSAQGAFYLWANVSHVSDGDVRSWAAGSWPIRALRLRRELPLARSARAGCGSRCAVPATIWSRVSAGCRSGSGKTGSLAAAGAQHAVHPGP